MHAAAQHMAGAANGVGGEARARPIRHRAIVRDTGDRIGPARLSLGNREKTFFGQEGKIVQAHSPIVRGSFDNVKG